MIEALRALEKDKIIISIQDTGVGIPAKHLETLFTTESVSSQGINQEVGTGLGLTLSKQLVESHGGETGVKSTVGQGSHFWIMLPLDSSE